MGGVSQHQAEWAEYFAECDAAAERADRRASNLTAFGAVMAALAVLTGVAFVAGLLAKAGDSERRHFIQTALPVTIGVAIGFLALSALLFGMASLVEASGHKLVLQLRAHRLAMRRAAEAPASQATTRTQELSDPFAVPPMITD
jgi:uncharacterized membrane protein required for colicin V production